LYCIVQYTGPYGIFHPPKKKGRKKERSGPASRDVIDHPTRQGTWEESTSSGGMTQMHAAIYLDETIPRKSKVKQRKKRKKNLLA